MKRLYKILTALFVTALAVNFIPGFFLVPLEAAKVDLMVPSHDPLVIRGADLFFNETFNGNGRTCGTCHPAENNFTIDPKFIASLPSDDPLFVAEFVPELAELENPDLMRKVGLILENTNGFDNPTEDFTMRGVPHTMALSTALTPAPDESDGTTIPPEERTGWSGDGAPNDGTLRDFATGAVIQHFTKTLNREPGVDFRLPTEDELDALLVFQLFLGRQEELDLSTLQLKGEVPRLGLEIFLTSDTAGGTVPAGKCNNCHANAGATVNFMPGGFNFNFNTGVENLPDQPADLVDEFNNPPDDGFGSPGDGTFNTPPLIEAADSGPFFHNNSIDTIEGAVAFFNSEAFNSSPAALAIGGISLEATQVVAVAAFLRVINALENIRSAGETAMFVEEVNQCPSARNLLKLAMAEVEDAVEVLEGGSLHPEAVSKLKEASGLLADSSQSCQWKSKNSFITQALELLQLARADMVEE